MSEFEKQRGLLMQLFDSQNALLSNVLHGTPLGAIQPVAESRPALVPAPVMAPPMSQPAYEAPEPASPPPELFQPEPVAPATAVQASAPAPSQAAPASAPAADSSVSLFDYVRSLMAKAVEMPAGDIDPDQNFMELGADSMTAMSMVKEIEVRYNIELPATLLFEYATLNELVDFLKTEIGDASGGSAQRA
jgi:acyl carrier protein